MTIDSLEGRLTCLSLSELGIIPFHCVSMSDSSDVCHCSLFAKFRKTALLEGMTELGFPAYNLSFVCVRLLLKTYELYMPES